MKFQNRRLASLAAVTLVASLALTACGGDDSSSANGDGGSGGGDGTTVTFIPKNLGNAYFDTSNAGGKKAVEEFGGSYEEVGPAEGSPDGQVTYINTATQQGRDALVISANDPDALCDAIGEARDADIKVVTYDADTNPDCRDLFINQ
ncbi:substrate-binding domain-containing protein, partial [Nocardioides lianchengensis]